MHVKSWNADISKGLIVIPGSYIVGVVERHPPEHLQKSVAKALNDYNASVARMVSHGDDAFRYKPQEPEGVENITLKFDVNLVPNSPEDYAATVRDAERYRFLRTNQLTSVNGKPVTGETFDGLVDQWMQQPVDHSKFMNDADDGRPCHMDKFVADLFEACDDPLDRIDAIDEWLHGDWPAAMAYLEDEDADEAGEHKEVIDAIDACDTGEDE